MSCVWVRRLSRLLAAGANCCYYAMLLLSYSVHKITCAQGDWRVLDECSVLRVCVSLVSET